MSWNSLDQWEREQLAKQLTPRQLDVYRLRLAGCPWQFIGEALHISPRTARTHWKRARAIHQQLELPEAA